VRPLVDRVGEAGQGQHQASTLALLGLADAAQGQSEGDVLPNR